jgi:TPR repeat protein
VFLFISINIFNFSYGVFIMKKQFLYSFILSTIFTAQASASDDEGTPFTGSSSGASVRGADYSSSSSSSSHKRSREKGKEVAEGDDSEADSGDDYSSSSAGLCHDDEGSSSASADSKRQRVSEAQLIQQFGPDWLVPRIGGGRPVLSLRPAGKRGQYARFSLRRMIMEQLLQTPAARRLIRERLTEEMQLEDQPVVDLFVEGAGGKPLPSVQQIMDCLGVCPESFAYYFSRIQLRTQRVAWVLAGVSPKNTEDNLLSVFMGNISRPQRAYPFSVASKISSEIFYAQSEAERMRALCSLPGLPSARVVARLNINEGARMLVRVLPSIIGRAAWEEARDWLRLAIATGNPNSPREERNVQCFLGVALFHLGGRANWEEARDLLRPLAATRFWGARPYLGATLYELGGRANLEEARDLFRIEEGFPAVLKRTEIQNYRYMTLLRLGDRTSLEEARDLFRPIAAAGNRRARFLLGRTLLKLGGRANWEEARDMFRPLAADTGGRRARFQLGCALLNLGGQENWEEARDIFRPLATVGNRGAQFNLGFVLFKLGGVENLNRAKELFTPLAENNYGKSKEILARVEASLAKLRSDSERSSSSSSEAIEATDD